jgi:hypothetical protein
MRKGSITPQPSFRSRDACGAVGLLGNERADTPGAGSVKPARYAAANQAQLAMLFAADLLDS